MTIKDKKQGQRQSQRRKILRQKIKKIKKIKIENDENLTRQIQKQKDQL